MRHMKWQCCVLLLVLLGIPAHGAERDNSAGAYHIIFAARHNGQSNIYIMQADGSGRRLLIENGAEPAISPNGRRIAFVRGKDIYLAHRDGSAQKQLTRHAPGVQVHHPAFSADNNRIVFALASPAATKMLSSGISNLIYNINLVNSDGSHERTVANDGIDPIYTPDGVSIIFARGGDVMTMVTNNMGGHAYVPGLFISQGLGVSVQDPTFSPNSRFLLLVISPIVPEPVPNIVRVNFANNQQESRLLHDASDPAYSPDGRHLAFVRERSIYIADADGSNVRQITNGPADSHPVWVQSER